MIFLEREYKELYANDKEELSELIQQWIDENLLKICCKLEEDKLKCRKTDR